ncbi:multidrug efflux SMR transporter [Hyphomicrobium sp. LHD-15]|uniref:DMT family transporter n=1 Tax=Hyphomicrobium sp. LHD-15 TaxID=3072142 RepID=UPI00280D1DCD|nr:multidrug efflux SMR transporter [Hyphomicrobium sp. LHD-15]MDQ8699977.1 multidrug efflux SMR transporter [Hyphomicrobium sp. LHD-15]
MGWIYLLLAGCIEVAFTTAIRYTDGFTKLWPTALVLVLAGVSFYLVAKSTATIPLGTAYAAWGGLGAAGTAVIGILYFGEPVTAWRLVFLTLLIVSIAGLKLVTD